MQNWSVENWNRHVNSFICEDKGARSTISNENPYARRMTTGEINTEDKYLKYEKYRYF